MSTTLGPPVSLDGPLPVAPPRGLLNSGAVTIVPPGSDRFGVGGVVWPYPPGLPHSFAPCAEGTFRDKADGEGWDLPEFNSFTLYLPITCSSLTAASPGFADRARVAFAARESWGVAQELTFAHANPLNPHLTDGNLTILAGGAALTPDVGLSWLEDAIGATGQAGVIHMTPATGAAVNGSGGYGMDLRAGALLTTANGTPVALDGGYQGARPQFGGAAPGAGQAWAFATGPVQVRRSGDIEMLADNIRESMDRSNNDVTYRAERDYLVTWDTQLQVAVLIDWSP